MRLGMRPDGLAGEAAAAGQRLVFVEATNPALFRQQATFERLQVLIPIAAAAGVLIVAALSVRMTRYRRTLESQRNAARLGETARVLSHEMKNPLGAIRLEVDYLRRVLPPEHRDGLQRVEAEARRLGSLTERIEDLLRDPGDSFAPIDVSAAVAAVAESQRMRCDVPADGAAPLARFDPDALRSVVENLVTNALQSGGPADEVEVAVRALQAKVEVAVRDRGAGIPEALRERVFEPFFTTKLQGSGIGLAIVRRFVAAAGGRVALRCRSGGGTEALVTLARCRGAEVPG